MTWRLDSLCAWRPKRRCPEARLHSGQNSDSLQNMKLNFRFKTFFKSLSLKSFISLSALLCLCHATSCAWTGGFRLCCLLGSATTLGDAGAGTPGESTTPDAGWGGCGSERGRCGDDAKCPLVGTTHWRLPFQGEGSGRSGCEELCVVSVVQQKVKVILKACSLKNVSKFSRLLWAKQKKSWMTCFKGGDA